jgi:hypothetical protein
MNCITLTSRLLFWCIVLVGCVSFSSAKLPSRNTPLQSDLRNYGYQGTFDAEADANYHAQGGGRWNGWSSSDDEKWHRAGNAYPEGYGKGGKIDGYEGDSDEADGVEELTFLKTSASLRMRQVS